ncbi:MAG: haloacid dehalogenase type II, partial [Acidimicrobiia bacterium]
MLEGRMRPGIIVFDVNETLLDLAALRPRFEAALGTIEPMGEWFARMLHGSLVANHTLRYRPFGQIGT